ncbi:hypothetical protein CKAH01_01548 [Colletotrichum kahawae]|uniref:Uncharacterized protein n=1 Tax=Colletotrichum kahawae TaxID=34407 RepID=A0AAD9Y7V7_COLKA|nr:hypothetical protein CKAH01_01548 [Colletotrichum kahawae]
MREPGKGRVPGAGSRRTKALADRGHGPSFQRCHCPWRNSRREHGRRRRALSQVPRVESQMTCPRV